jgi:tRNA A-37 threonylcarbamoyl transferase component Bud32
MAGTFYIDECYRVPLAAIGLRDFRSVMDARVGIPLGTHDDRNAVRLEVELDGQMRQVYLKRTLRHPLAALLKELLTGVWPQARPIREYRMARTLGRLGIPAMKAIGCGQRRRLWMPHQAFVLVEAVPARFMLDQVLQVRLTEQAMLSARQKHELVRALGALVRQLHDADLRWPDLVAKHIFLDPPSGDEPEHAWELFLIDLERMYASRSAKACARDLVTLLKSMPPRSIGRTDLLRFAGVYAGVDGRAWPDRRKVLERRFGDFGFRISDFGLRGTQLAEGE